MLGDPVNRRANVYVLAFQENAIGSGGGYYNNQALFKSREGHGSFVPLCGLLKAEDYDNGSTGGSSPASFQVIFVVFMSFYQE